MRKSERIRLLEIQVARLELQMEIVTAAFASLSESNFAPAPDLDANKWYKRESE